jgi:four helix bundle protein
MKDFRELVVWEKSHQLTLAVYKETAGFPKNELYGLTSQIRRACSSIAANIAEGCGRIGDPEFCRFLTIASGSASEVDYHLLLARDLGYYPAMVYDRLRTQIIEVRRMLASLIRKIKTDQEKK